MVNNRDRKSFGSHRKNSKICLDDWHRWHFWSALRHVGTHFVESFRMSRSSWMMDPTRWRKMPSYSSKISSWILSIISGLVTVLRHPGRGASQVEKSPCLNWATQFLTLAYDGTCYPNVFVRMVRISFGALPWRAGKNLKTARVSILLKLRASPDMLPFSLCNKKRLAIRHMTPLSNDTINSVLRHREVGRAKDLSAPPRVYVCIYYPYRPRLSHLIEIGAKILKVKRVDSRFLKYLFILHISFNNKPNDEVYLRQDIHTYTYVCIYM